MDFNNLTKEQQGETHADLLARLELTDKVANWYADNADQQSPELTITYRRIAAHIRKRVADCRAALDAGAPIIEGAILFGEMMGRFLAAQTTGILLLPFEDDAASH